jgi:hypothetical protein
MIPRLSNYPLYSLPFFIGVMWVAVRIGQYAGKKYPPSERDTKGLDLITNASLTLLALIIGFSFSMAVGRYDLRKAYEEEEANAIGTEYVRAGLMSSEDMAKIRTMLKEYLDQRIVFYMERNSERLEQLSQETGKLQNQMWTAVQDAAILRQTPIMAQVVSGMNDVLNRQGYTQAAWWNRIPRGAWVLMTLIALCSCGLIGYGVSWRRPLFTLILPVVIAMAFFLISDIDSPRRGVIRVAPQNLISLAESLRTQ